MGKENVELSSGNIQEINCGNAVNGVPVLAWIHESQSIYGNFLDVTFNSEHIGEEINTRYKPAVIGLDSLSPSYNYRLSDDKVFPVVYTEKNSPQTYAMLSKLDSNNVVVSGDFVPTQEQDEVDQAGDSLSNFYVEIAGLLGLSSAATAVWMLSREKERAGALTRGRVKKDIKFSRRDFLKTAALGIGTLVAGPLIIQRVSQLQTNQAADDLNNCDLSDNPSGPFPGIDTVSARTYLLTEKEKSLSPNEFTRRGLVVPESRVAVFGRTHVRKPYLEAAKAYRDPRKLSVQLYGMEKDYLVTHKSLTKEQLDLWMQYFVMNTETSIINKIEVNKNEGYVKLTPVPDEQGNFLVFDKNLELTSGSDRVRLQRLTKSYSVAVA